MSQALKFLQGVGAEDKLYVDNVFQSYVRTGVGAEQTVTTNIDMTKGYMVWSKGRSGTTDHAIYDSARGVTYDLVSNSTAAQTTQTQGLKSVSATGHTWGTLAKVNTSSATYVDWTFRKSPKFVDVVTYTGDGLSDQQITHSLKSVPGLVIVKPTSATGNWGVWHRGNGTTDQTALSLNATTAAQNAGPGFYAGFTSTYFSPRLVEDAAFNVGNLNGVQYVAYLFAHDTSADGIIQCGSFTTDGSGNATVNLGWEPQFVNFKRSDSTGGWHLADVYREWNVSTDAGWLFANTSAAENNGFYGNNRIKPTSTGFSTTGVSASATYIYLAIRRPNKPPTSGTQVYNADLANASTAPLWEAPFPVDLGVYRKRDSTTASFYFGSRLTGTDRLSSWSADAAVTDTGFKFDYMTGWFNNAFTDSQYIGYSFRRAPGVFDEVCYTGTGVAKTEAHNLGVVPELMIVKCRSSAGENWAVYSAPTGNGGVSVLNLTAATASDNEWNYTTPTSSVFSIGPGSKVNGSGFTYVAYLFATKAGISKVGSYTGNGSSQTINCGFTTGSRFVLIKRTSSTGDWYVWDSTRGIIAGNDPHLALNSTAAEVTTDDSVDTDASGFIVNQVAATNINVTSATYIYLSLA